MAKRFSIRCGGMPLCQPLAEVRAAGKTVEASLIGGARTPQFHSTVSIQCQTHPMALILLPEAVQVSEWDEDDDCRPMQSVGVSLTRAYLIGIPRSTNPSWAVWKLRGCRNLILVFSLSPSSSPPYHRYAKGRRSRCCR